MSRFPGLGVIALLGLTATPSYAGETSTVCPIAVDFPSECCGPDAASMREIQRVLATKAFNKVRVDTYGWGLEGESTWCIYPSRAHNALLIELHRIVAEATPPRDVPSPQIRLNEHVRGTYRGQLKPARRLPR
jgi:hypothetical protein